MSVIVGRMSHMDVTADINRIIFEPMVELWRRPPGQPHSTWLSSIADDLTFDLGLLEARDVVQNCSFWKPLSSHTAT